MEQANEMEKSAMTADDRHVDGNHCQVRIATSKRGPPDGGFGWVVVFCTFCLVTVVLGTWSSFGLFYVKFSEVFPENKATIGWIGSLNMGFAIFLGLPVSSLAQRWGCRPLTVAGTLVGGAGLLASAFANSVPMLYVTYGIVAGCGQAMMLQPSFLIVQLYFTKRRALAAGITSMGICVGSIIIPQITGFCLKKYGWRGAMLIGSAINFQVCVCAALLRPLGDKSPTKQTVSDQTKESGQGKHSAINHIHHFLVNWVLFDIRFSLIVVGTVLFQFGMFTLVLHMPSRAVFYGADPDKTSFILLAYGGVDTISRIIFSVVSNLPTVNRTAMYGAGIVLGGIILILTTAFKSFISLIILCGAYGFSLGVCLTVQMTILSDQLGIAKTAQAQGTLLSVAGIGAFFTGAFAGWLFDMSGSYDPPLIVTGALQLLGGIISLSVLVVNKYRPADITRNQQDQRDKCADMECVPIE